MASVRRYPRRPMFVTPLHFEDPGGLPFTLIDTLIYGLTTALGKPPVFISVPAGFPTDLASIPRLLWNVLPPVGRYDAAAVVHDYLYQRAPVFEHGQVTTRAGADAVLLEAMACCEVPTWQRWTIYLGVRVGGWLVWGRYRARERR
jgi:hypothetical protein